MYTTIKNDKGEVVFYGSNFDLWDDYISHAEHEDMTETFALVLACIADGNMRDASR